VVAREAAIAIGSFVALGDSFTEGLDDPRADQAGYRGWADRFAGMLAESVAECERARQLDPGVHDESGLAGAREGHLAELFAAAGLDDIASSTVSARVRYATFEEWWQPFEGGVGPAGGYVVSLDAVGR
jgi:hypothetical protein